MATKIISQENQYAGIDLVDLAELATKAMSDVLLSLDKVHSVASAGRVFCTEEETVECRLFEVIQDLTESTQPISNLHRLFKAIVQRAEVAHG